jgi:kumamolisin
LAATPGSLLFRQYLAPADLSRQYGPSASSIDAAVQYFEHHGLSARPTADGLFLDVRGPASRVGGAFATSFQRYGLEGRTVFAHAGPASLPAGVPWTGALGLGDTTPLRPALSRPVPVPFLPDATTCPAGQPYVPCEVHKAFNATALISSGFNGSGYRVAVVDTYDSSEPQTALSKDLNAFLSEFNLTRGNVTFVYPVPTSVNLNNSPASGWGAEEVLDLQWARASAPGAAVEMTMSPDASVGLYYSVDWLVAHQAADVISLSWGEPDVGIWGAFSGGCRFQCNATTDGSYTLLHPVLQAAAAEGIGVFAASGDCGAAGGTSGVATDFPSSDPFVTGVGGTVLAVATGGGYKSESGWSGNSTGAVSPGCVNQGGSGGGYSPYPRPAWQAAPGINASTSGRGVPDVALLGGSSVAVVIGNVTVGVGGTSAATPMWSGFEAIADQRAGARLGSLNPSLYALARGTGYSQLFHDVLTGNNGYAARAGWDPITGLGTPIESALAPALAAGPTLSNGLRVDLYGSPRLGPTPLATSFRVAVQGGVSPLPFVDVYFGDGNASRVPVSLEIDHTYPSAGVFQAAATVVDSTGNSSTSLPLAVVVGGGHDLTVPFNVSNATPPIGAEVTLTASASNGTGPYRYSFYFGDGTYDVDRANGTDRHAYGAMGGYCAAVVVVDSALHRDGGSSARLPVTVGGATAATCPTPSVLTATLASSVLARDLPGDFPLLVNATGGTPPVSVQYVSGDPYVRACDCGIFRSSGNQTVRAYVNDSLDQQTLSTIDVTLFPALASQATISRSMGPAPLGVDFRIAPSGGHFTAAPVVNWSFGDGTTLTGSNETPHHDYVNPGVYTAWVRLTDQGGGVTGAAWIIEATNANTTGLAVQGSIVPAVGVAAGSLVRFAANASGGVAPYSYRWTLGDNDSAYGSTVNQTYSLVGCLGRGTCPLTIALSVRDSMGAAWSHQFVLPGALHLRSSGGVLTDSGPISPGATPYRFTASASATGVVGLAIRWDFGDGTISTGRLANHTYYSAGNYTIVETATDPFGDLLVRTQAVSVTGPSYPPLYGALQANVTTGVSPLPVSFNLSASGGSGGPYAVNWAFGDGATAMTDLGPPANHTFTSGGSYTVTATVRDVTGDTLDFGLNLTVFELTLVHLNLSVSPQPVETDGGVGYAVHVSPRCLALSVPGCTNSSVPLFFRVSAPGAAFFEGTRLPGTTYAAPTGWANGTLAPLGNFSGSIWIWVLAGGPNYSGAAHVNETVVGPTVDCPSCAPSGGFPWAALFPLVVVLGVSTAVAAGLVWWRIARRRAEAPRDGPEADVPSTPPSP